MKRTISIIFLTFIFICCVPAKSFFRINENFDTMKFEIFIHDQKKLELPFSQYCGYKLFKNKYFFINCSKSRIPEYGRLCYFELDTEEFIYTDIMSGSTFYIIEDFIIISSLAKSKVNTDVEDVFGLDLPVSQYPLDVTIYNGDTFKKIKELNFDKYRQDYSHKTLFLDINSTSDEMITFSYGIYDTTYKINIGTLNLATLEFDEMMENK